MAARNERDRYRGRGNAHRKIHGRGNAWIHGLVQPREFSWKARGVQYERVVYSFIILSFHSSAFIWRFIAHCSGEIFLRIDGTPGACNSMFP